MARHLKRSVEIGLAAINVEGGLISPEKLVEIAATVPDAKAALIWRMYRRCWCSASSPREVSHARWLGSLRYARLVSSNCRYVQPSPPSADTSWA